MQSSEFSNVKVHVSLLLNETIMIATRKCEHSDTPRSSENYTLIIESSAWQLTFSNALQKAIRDSGWSCDICYLDSLNVSSEDSKITYIFLAELESPVLETLSAEKFRTLRNVLVLAKKVLWLTGQSSPGILPPDRAMIDGLARVLRAEKQESVMVTASLELSPIDDQVGHILSLLRHVGFDSINQPLDLEYILQNSRFYIKRLMPSKQVSREIHEKSLPYQSKNQAFGAGPPLKLTVGTPGLLNSLLNSLHFVQDHSVEDPL